MQAVNLCPQCEADGDGILDRPTQDLVTRPYFCEDRIFFEALSFEVGYPINGKRVIQKTSDIVGVLRKAPFVRRQAWNLAIGNDSLDPLLDGLSCRTLAQALFQLDRILPIQHTISERK
jgi:hypothetical protein